MGTATTGQGSDPEPARAEGADVSPSETRGKEGNEYGREDAKAATKKGRTRGGLKKPNEGQAGAKNGRENGAGKDLQSQEENRWSESGHGAEQKAQEVRKAGREIRARPEGNEKASAESGSARGDGRRREERPDGKQRGARPGLAGGRRVDRRRPSARRGANTNGSKEQSKGVAPERKGRRSDAALSREIGQANQGPHPEG